MYKTYCFDIDDTICVTDGLDYEKSIPIKDRIDKVNKLKEQGHKIIFFTARGFVTKIDYRELTLGQLEDWGVRFDELYMGKPAADYYIDDKNSDVFGWFK